MNARMPRGGSGTNQYFVRGRPKTSDIRGGGNSTATAVRAATHTEHPSLRSRETLGVQALLEKRSRESGVEIGDMTKADIQKMTTEYQSCLLYTSPSPRDQRGSRMPSSA